MNACNSDAYPTLRYRTREGEIEIVAYDGRDLVLAGEAKWHNGEVGTDALGQLQETVRFVPGYGPRTKLVIYARDGFTDQLRSRAASSGVVLRTVEDVYGG